MAKTSAASVKPHFPSFARADGEILTEARDLDIARRREESDDVSLYRTVLEFFRLRNCPEAESEINISSKRVSKNSENS